MEGSAELLNVKKENEGEANCNDEFKFEMIKDNNTEEDVR